MSGKIRQKLHNFALCYMKFIGKKGVFWQKTTSFVSTWKKVFKKKKINKTHFIFHNMNAQIFICIRHFFKKRSRRNYFFCVTLYPSLMNCPTQQLFTFARVFQIHILQTCNVTNYAPFQPVLTHKIA